MATALRSDLYVTALGAARRLHERRHVTHAITAYDLSKLADIGFQDATEMLHGFKVKGLVAQNGTRRVETGAVAKSYFLTREGLRESEPYRQAH